MSNKNNLANEPVVSGLMVDSGEFVAALRGAANGVSVVTTDGKAGRHGGTVSSFCSVSADPPTMLVCLNKASQIQQLVAENGCFTINVLSDGDSFTANRFAGFHDKEVTDRFAGIEFVESSTGPILPNSLVLNCTVDQRVDSGSHTIFVGLVEQVIASDHKPLTYSNGAYHSIVSQNGDGKS